jgi:hypothetical protein
MAVGTPFSLGQLPRTFQGVNASGAFVDVYTINVDGTITFNTAVTLDVVLSAVLSIAEGGTGATTAAAALAALGPTATAAEINYNDIATLGTGAASKAVVLDAGEDYTWPATGILTYGVLKDPAGTTLGATVAELNKLDDSVTVLTKGAGVSAAESYAVGYLRNGTLVTTRIVVDLTGLVGSATDLDIIGNTGGAASAHWGQITAALNGTMVGGRVTCLEVPAGGTDDIDFYSATVSTGAQDVDVTTLTETVLVTSGGAWTSGASKGMTTVPPANDYLYITNGAAAGGTFTAGKFLIELYGYVA